jgi:hypothetical protein
MHRIDHNIPGLWCSRRRATSFTHAKSDHSFVGKCNSNLVRESRLAAPNPPHPGGRVIRGL